MTETTNKPPSASDGKQSSLVSREVSLAFRNAVKLMISMVVTLGVAFVVRLWIPRFLGPETFGMLHFSEQFVLMMFFIVGFGADIYIRKEVSYRPEHASDIFGGLILFRLGLVFLIFAIEAASLYWMKKESLIWYMVYVFSFAHFFVVLNQSFAALLHSQGTVNEVSIVTAVGKIVWGAGCVVGLLLGFGPISIPISLVISETIKTPFLLAASRKHLSLELRFNIQSIKDVIVTNLPYCASFVLIGVYNRIDTSFLSAMTNDAQVGWYGAAYNIFFIVLLFIPMVSAIVMPMGARLLQESEEVLARTIQKTNRLMIMITVPIAIMITLNADLIVSILFSGNYGPSVNIIRIQSPIIPLTYFNTISAMHLMQLGGIRHQVKIALICCLTKAVLSPLLIILGMKYFDSGGLAIAVSNVLTECLSAFLLTSWLRKQRPGDSQLVSIAGRLLIVFLLVGGVHLFAARLGYFVLLVDFAVYAVIASALKVMPIREFVELLKKGRRRASS